MKRNLYFRTVMRRQNVLTSFLLNAFLNLASWPRLILEVFIRRNPGERYFSLSSAVSVAVLLFFIPLFAHKAASYSGDGGSFWVSYSTWYLFLLGFLYFSWLRWQEVRRKPSVFNFAKFSLYAGDVHPAFKRLKIVGNTQTIRTIETLLEPAAFFMPGLFLLLLGQKIGLLLLICSIFYALSYCAAYRKGDNFIMDTIDEMIMNEELTSVFVDNADAEQGRGVRFYMKKPGIKALRQKIADAFLEDDMNDLAENQTIAA